MIFVLTIFYFHLSENYDMLFVIALQLWNEKNGASLQLHALNFVCVINFLYDLIIPISCWYCYYQIIINWYIS